MKPYCGSPAAARHYVEADLGRADDYYLAEGTGIAERYVASPDDGVCRLAPLTGDGYEAWVAGVDPDTGVPKGRLRHDERAVRFVEVTVNGPKSWSLAAELHPDISRAYDGAQDRAAMQIIGWLAQHSTTRVGPRGAQVQVPVTEIEAVTVRHYTSRAGDPHRHLHLQINARVFAEGRWRGLHTVGVRDSLDAINGIGHAAVMTDPQFRDALTGHGFTLSEDGEVQELAPFTGAFSARAAQIGRNIETYEADWRVANPGHEPGPATWRAWDARAWDARAWADGRPDKVAPRDGAELTRRWVSEMHALGYRDGRTVARVDAFPVGRLDRDQVVGEVLSRLAARRSGWNAADIRGEVEQLIARRNVVTHSAVRGELAEDLTARTLTLCMPLTDRAGVPEHIRALTSRHVLDVEADIAGRLAARANPPVGAAQARAINAVAGLDDAQREVVAALGSDAQLLVIEGAAGAGKTTTLAAARTVIEQHGARLRVVTPTLKAARVAAEQVGADASSAAWLAYQHGYRWDQHGTWIRLALGATDPKTGVVFHGPGDNAVLHRGDVVLVDEAGMLDQDTAHTLLTIADEHGVRIALVGDRHQLPAVGRGGVLDLAARFAAPEACLPLDTVHRFTRTDTIADGVSVCVADEQYAQLSLAMRAGSDPDAVFDALLARDQIRVHASDAERLAALAGDAVDGSSAGTATVIVADTNEQVAVLNAAIRERRVATGQVDDEHASTTNAGQRIGIEDRVATRRNDANLGVANRDTWTIIGVAGDGSLVVTGGLGERWLPAGYVREHVVLAYASTAHGVQGNTTTAAHAVIGVHTSAASAYVAMTRGRETNVAHLVADSVDEAREQWVAVFSRDRADLGPARAGELAAAEASRYAELRQVEQVMTELHRAWTVEQDCLERLVREEQRRDALREIVPLRVARDRDLPPLEHAYRQAQATELHAREHAQTARTTLATDTERIRDALLDAWDEQHAAIRVHAQTVRDGIGRFGRGHAAVTGAGLELTGWADAWRPDVPDLPTSVDRLADWVLWFEDRPQLWDTLDAAARGQAEHENPDAVAAIAAAEQAADTRREASRVYRDADRYYAQALTQHGNLAHAQHPEQQLTRLETNLEATGREFTSAQATITALLGEPTLRSLPADRISTERETWRAERDTRTRERYTRSAQRDAHRSTNQLAPGRTHGYDAAPSTPDHSPGISR